jgi:hypothetical protein
MKQKMLGIGAIAILAVMLIATSNVSTHDVFAKRYGQSNVQSAAINNECRAVQALDNSGNQAGVNQIAGFTTNCIGDANMIQDSDGAAATSAPTATGDTTLPPLG